jgi:hypothetical protein
MIVNSLRTRVVKGLKLDTQVGVFIVLCTLLQFMKMDVIVYSKITIFDIIIYGMKCWKAWGCTSGTLAWTDFVGQGNSLLIKAVFGNENFLYRQTMQFIIFDIYKYI